jgi:hypothetical protein
MNSKITAICISTLHSKTLSVLIESIDAYVPQDVEIYINYCGELKNHQRKNRTILQSNHKAGSYGDAYNYVVRRAFAKHEQVLVCNDDIVFNPYTYNLIQQDFDYLLNRFGRAKIGWIGCLTDFAIGMQNIRMDIRLEGEDALKMSDIKRGREYYVSPTNFIAPICALVTKDAWIDYMPVNFFSDTLQCMQMRKSGLEHYVSRAYVHHVGSQSMKSYGDETKDALEILKVSHPQEYAMLKDRLKMER